MDRDQIIARLHEIHAGYAAQDNVEAAKVARIFANLLEEIDTPTIEQLRIKFLGTRGH